MGRGLSVAAKIYLTGVTLAAVGLIVTSMLAVGPELTRSVLMAAFVLGVLCLILEFINFPLLISGDTSFSTVAYMAMVLMLPFPLPAIVGAVVVLAADLRHRKPLVTLAFNASNFALTLGLSSLVWYLMYGHRTISELPLSITALLTIVAVIVVFYTVNVFLMNIIIAIIGHRSVKYIWLTNDLDFLLPYICLEVVGVLAALLWETVPILLPLLVIPAVTTYIAFEMIHRLQQQTQEAMLAMADAIDRRDPYTAGHSLRVAELAVRIGEVYGMNERDLERLRLAARLHDIGKIGIGNDILHKEGKLTDDEWKIMKEHPVIGEQLLRPYRQFRHEVRLVRSHHERWDGKGYPDGLHGQAIPVGSRIIAIADTFDAMTTSRPYRGPLPRQMAIDTIRNGALSQFDPQLVASFLQVVEQWGKIRSITGEELPVIPGMEHTPTWYSALQ